MKTMRTIQNAGGFTTIELFLSIAMAGLVALGLYGGYSWMYNHQASMSKGLESYTDTEAGRRVIFQDLKAVDPSYGNLLVKDDSGKHFFDYYPDVSPELFGADVSRELTLGLETGKKREIQFLVTDNDADPVPMAIYDPPAAYEITPDVDFNKDGKLKFISLNKDDFVTDELGRPNFWKKNQLLMLDTAAMIRGRTGAVLDPMIQPRSPIFVGRVVGQRLEPIPALSTIVNNKDPSDPLGAKVVDSADTFLRVAPGVGGGMPLVRLKAVKLLRYTLDPYKERKKGAPLAGRLTKHLYLDGKYSRSFGLAENVRALKFIRNSVCDKSIQFSIETVN